MGRDPKLGALRLCWFCACHTKHTLKYEPIAIYLEALKQEIAAVGALVSPDAVVSAVHFGGGSPTMLDPQDMQDLMDCLRRHFTFGLAPEISVEMDPNDLDDSRYDALAAIGMSRASLGVQDFDDKVQKTINRIQSFEQTKSVVDAVRARGVHSVNCDILYGLPFQTCETLKTTVDQIVSLDPDRIALFGYAHVPWMKKHQSLIPEHALPDVTERYRQMTMAGEMLRQAGLIIYPWIAFSILFWMGDNFLALSKLIVFIGTAALMVGYEKLARSRHQIA